MSEGLFYTLTFIAVVFTAAFIGNMIDESIDKVKGNNTSSPSVVERVEIEDSSVTEAHLPETEEEAFIRHMLECEENKFRYQALRGRRYNNEHERWRLNVSWSVVESGAGYWVKFKEACFRAKLILIKDPVERLQFKREYLQELMGGIEK